MKTSNLLAAAALASSCVSALRLAPRSANPKVVGLDIERRQPRNIVASDRSRLRKRAGTVEETLDNEETLYFANVTLGTPAQSIRLHIDTGSSDLWVNTANSSLCSSGRQTSCIGGTFQPSSSSSLKVVNDLFNISYVDGSSATGNYVTDTLVFGSVSLSNFQFGLGEVSSSYEGVLGIGYEALEVQASQSGGSTYPNLPQALENGGLIARNAYSLWLNDLDASTGTILFGGVNTAKYTGELATLPVIPLDGAYYYLAIALTGVSVAGSKISSSSLPTAAVLDSGTTLTYLPNDIASAIYTKVGATYSEEAGAAYAPCSLASSSSALTFTFSGQTISVAYDELLIETTDVNGAALKFENGETACIFGIAPSEGSTTTLGDTFLRSAYVVYDLTNNEISIAQTVFNTSASDVREITSGSALVPGATLVASAVSTGLSTSTAAAEVAGSTKVVSAASSRLAGSAPLKQSTFALVVLVALASAGYF